jgi:hypothetical protein
VDELSLTGETMIANARAVLVLMLLSCGGNPGDGRESPGDKREWSILQRMEPQSAESRATGFEVRKIDQYYVLGVPRDGDSRTIWVMLNPSHPPLYKQMPDGNFWLSADQLEELAHHEIVTSTVEQALRSHLRAE